MARFDSKCGKPRRAESGLVVLALLGPLGATPLDGQAAADSARGRWSIGVSVGAASFSGSSREAVPSGEHLTFAPYRAATWGLRVEYGGEGARFGVSARYGQPGVRIRGVPATGEEPAGSGVVVLIENAFHLSSFGAFASTRLHRLRSGPSLRGLLGLGIERWASPDAPIRTIGGAMLGLGAEVGLGGGFVAALEGELGVTPASPFRQGELPEGYQPRATWRQTLAGVLSWRF